ncbi:MAG: beta-lactamase family protein [Acidimicrobiia bacterium]|nr:beta-lactamase family protein [Acidimicrobiia bacterium]
MVTTSIVRLGESIIRRCPIPSDVDAVTTIGAEAPRDGIEAVWARIVTLYRTGVHPAVQVCLRHRGEVVLHRSIGHARGVAPGQPIDDADAVLVDLDTPVNLFSAAKAVTTMTMHKLEELGVLDLDDRIAGHLPDFARHGKHRITIRQVLTHRAGIPSLPSHAFDLDLLADADGVDELVCDLEPTRTAGGPPAYHAVTGGFVMDSVARAVTGRSLRDILKAEVKEPLGLKWFDYGVAPDQTDAVAHNVTTGFPLTPLMSRHFRRLLGRGWEEVIELSNDPRFLRGVIPSGNVIVTAGDTAGFYQCLLDGGTLDGTRVFEPHTVARAVADDTGRGMSFDRMIGMPFRYGDAGFMHGTDTISLYGWNHPRAFGHVGMSNSFTWADPDRELVVALLTTGKPILGTHLLALPQVISEIHRTFPPRT